MSDDRPRQRIDWNGEGHDTNVVHVLKSRGWMRKASVPAAIGLVGLALVGALAAGPMMRSVTAGTEEAATPPLETAAIVPAATAQAAPVEAAAEPSSDDVIPAQAPVVDAATASETTARPEATQSAGLAANDPRWNPQALEIDSDKLTALKEAVAETVAAAEIATAMGNSEGLTTSGIPSTAAGFAPERPASPVSERSAFDAALVSEDEQAEVASANLAPAKANQYVNMRAGPADDATILTVVPANASIQAETDCRWCEVSYDGKTGYIYQSFIAR